MTTRTINPEVLFFSYAQNGTLSMTGSTIANRDEHGNDNGNLNIVATSLEWADLFDYSYSSQTGFSLGVTVSGIGAKPGVGDNPDNSTIEAKGTIGVTNTGHEKEGTTRATIGEGNIVVRDGSDISGLNRDIDRAQTVERDTTTGALDGKLEIDSRLFTTAGQEEILDSFTGFYRNTVMAGMGATGTVLQSLVSVYSVAINDSISASEIVNVWQTYQLHKAYGVKGGASEEVHNLMDNITNGNATPEDLRSLSSLIRGKAANIMYADSSEVFTDEDGNKYAVMGKHDNSTGIGAVNTANGAATNARTFLETDAHEAAHNSSRNEAVAGNAASMELGYYSVASFLLGYDRLPTISEGGFGTTMQANWNETYNASTSTLLARGNYIAGSMLFENIDYLLYKMSGGVIVDTDDMPKGELSKKEEVGNGNAGTTNVDKQTSINGYYKCPDPKSDPGGCSYGLWQISTSSARDKKGYGSMDAFIKSLETNAKDIYDVLDSAGGAKAAKAGKEEFVRAWKYIADTDTKRFEELQQGFVYENNYQKPLGYISENYKALDMSNPIMQDIVWSMGVQHIGSPTIIKRALDKVDLSSATTAEIVVKMYDERIIYVNNDSKLTTSLARSLTNRFEREKRAALNKVDKQVVSTTRQEILLTVGLGGD
ncbi:hypothetical protein AGMMS49941_11950 [Deferribacterales bacterium]|nr:hypothetical protein AGMMS49941_11950 [Deferribacterales bacterium]